ncbi:Hypothetical protein NTJ_04360 [Nesidiocoris tenuis]|uniref:Uncharacterized protein n=1 Tax=Nesidiocoris tenuis TaxID=355587 RepID=A0ABN7AMI5_9HEMI|nr:Hypothetical protein NTJ_04360 [Nesidiocoris tenuis]
MLVMRSIKRGFLRLIVFTSSVIIDVWPTIDFNLERKDSLLRPNQNAFRSFQTKNPDVSIPSTNDVFNQRQRPLNPFAAV